MLAIVQGSKFSLLNSSIKDTLRSVDRFMWQAVDELREMQTKKPYTEAGYKNFEEYCESELCEWGGYRRVKQLLGAKKVFDMAEPDFGDLIRNERQARPLLRLVKQPEKFKEAIRIALEETPRPTESTFAIAVKKASVIPHQGNPVKEPLVPFDDFVKISSQKDDWAENEKKPRLYTQVELDEAITTAIKEALLAHKVELEAAAATAAADQLEAARKRAAQFQAKNTQLLQEIEQLQNLKGLEVQNYQLSLEVDRLNKALEILPAQQWNKQTFNSQAAKVLNKEVKSFIEKLEPDLHLRVMANAPPSKEMLPTALDLLGQAIAHLLPLGMDEYRQTLKAAQTWADFEPVANTWTTLKLNVWNELTKEEKTKIKELKEQNLSATPAFKVGDRVMYLGDCYDSQWGCSGEIVGQVFGDYKIRWHRPDGSRFDSRHSIDEIESVRAGDRFPELITF